MRILLLLLFTCSLTLAVVNNSEFNYQNRVVLYLMDNGLTEEQAYYEIYENGRVQISKDRNGVRIRGWKIPDIQEPLDEELPSDMDTDVLKVPEKDRKKVNGKWEKKTIKEIQNSKSNDVKKIENKIIQFFWDEGVIPIEQQLLIDGDWDNMYTHIEDLPDSKFMKLNKDVTLLEKKGGDRNDVYWHDDI